MKKERLRSGRPFIFGAREGFEESTALFVVCYCILNCVTLSYLFRYVKALKRDK